MILPRALQALAVATAAVAIIALATKGVKVIAPVVFGVWMAATLWAAAAAVGLLSQILQILVILAEPKRR